MTRVLITGASGFLGGWLCKVAKENGMVVGGTYRTTPPDLGVSQYLDHTLSMHLPTDGSAVVKEFNPDAVVHAAAMSSVEECERRPDEAWEMNVRGSREIARAAERTGSRFVFVSTNFVYNGRRGPYVESDEPDPIQVYGRTKLEAEESVSRVHSAATVVRVSDLYGPAVDDTAFSEFVGWVVDSLRSRDPVELVEDVYMSPTAVDASARDVISLLKDDATGCFHRSGASCLNRVEFGRTIADVFGLDGTPIRSCAHGEIWEAERPYCTCLLSERIGDRAVATEETLENGLRRLRQRPG